MKIDQLEKASAAYYAGNPIMTDAEFDAAVIKLQKTDPNHPFLKRIGAPVHGKEKVKHQMPMGSLDNVNNEEEFRNWIPDNHKRLVTFFGNNNYYLKPIILLSHKLDGSSLELIYQNGSFIQAITRGDGETGEDVTRNVLRSGNVPLSIAPSVKSVRCECLIHKDDWVTHFRGDANPRNSAAGTLRRHDGHNAQYLRFYAFDAVIDQNVFDAMLETSILLVLDEWFDTPTTALENNIDLLIKWCQSQEAKRDELPYEIDGVVAKVNDRIASQRMGIRDGRPKGQIAIKFKPRGGETILRNVTWQVGHTGALTPVGEVDPVGVGGTIIKRVTLCNPEEITRLEIALGDTVEIVRAGDVIPKLSKLIKKGKERQAIISPNKCPECGSKTKKDGAKIFCINDECPGQSFGRIMTWIKKRNILNLGIGVVKAAKIESITNLYKMSIDEWTDVQVKNGVFGRKRAKKVIEALEKSKTVSLAEFLGSIGAKGVGRSLASILCDGLGCKTLDDVFGIHPEQLKRLEGFGSARAYDFCSWLRQNRGETGYLASLMRFEKEDDMSGNNVFQNETLCFTGKSPRPRSEMNCLAEAAGALVSSSVNNKTTILVIADISSTSSKAVKARKLGIKLISPEDFLSQV